MAKNNYIFCTGDKNALKLGGDERRYFLLGRRPEYTVTANLNTEAFDIWKLAEPQDSYITSKDTEAEAWRYAKQLQDGEE